MSKLWKALTEARKQLSIVPKSGRNTYDNYDYAKDEDIINTINTKLLEQGIMHSFRQLEASVNDKGEAFIKGELLLAHGETGETQAFGGFGFSSDRKKNGYGDKALFKAITGARKYAYLCAMGLCSGEDAEKESPVQLIGATPEQGEMAQYVSNIKTLMDTFDLTPAIVQEITGLQTLQGQSLDSLIEVYNKLVEVVGT